MSDKKILKSIATKLGEKGVAYLKKNNELPAVKLSAEEMKFLAGGGTKLLISIKFDCGMPIIDTTGGQPHTSDGSNDGSGGCWDGRPKGSS